MAENNEYHISVIGKNSTTGVEYIIIQDAVITQTGRYIKDLFDLSVCPIDQSIIKNRI